MKITTYNNIYKKIKLHFYLKDFVIFIFKIILFFLTKSFYFIISSLYNICIGLSKKNVYHNSKDYKKIALYLILASLCFIFYSILIIKFHKISEYHIYIGIAVAAVTFSDIGIAIYGIIKYKDGEDTKIIKKINLATALISLDLTQTAILSYTNPGIDNSLYNGILGINVGIISLIIGLHIFKQN